MIEQDMRSDAELLDTLLCEAPAVVDRGSLRVVILSAKLIAHWTGRAVQTVSDYRTGKLNIPVEFWRLILEHYFDHRIISLMVPSGYRIEAWPLDTVMPRTGAEFFREAVRSEADHAESQKYIAEMLADGRIDELDEASVQAYDDAYGEHIRTDSTLHHAIILAYNRAVARKQRAQT